MIALLLLGEAGWAASELNFPRLSFDSITGIAIVNPTDQDAEVSLSVYGESGELIIAAGFTNPASVMVGKGRQISRVAEEIFGSSLEPEVVAWIQATSPVDGLTGFFLSLDAGPTFFDGADLPESSNRIVFPEVCLRDDCTTELNLINPGDLDLDVTLEIIGLGQAVASPVQLPARGVARLNPREILESQVAPSGAPLPDTAYLIASSDGVIAGFEFVQREGGDLLGLNAKPADELLNTIFFPQLAVLGLFQSQITIVNLGESQAIVTFRAFRPDGVAYGAADLLSNPVSRPLEPGERLTADLETLFGYRGDETLSGWILVESTSVSINGSLTYAIPSINSLAAVASQAQGSTSAVFSHIATTLGFFTGIAILNPGTLPANVRIVAIEPDGTILGSFTTVVEPRHRVAELVDDLIPQARNQAGGFIIIRSNVPVFLTSLFGSLGNGVLANVPAQRIPNSFRPDDVIPQLRLNPPLAVIQPGQSRAFQIQGVEGAVSWSVNGIEGGTVSAGLIDAAGQYDAPSQMPDTLPVTIAGEVNGQRAAASVDVLSLQTLVQNLGAVQSIAYLEGLRQLFTAELSTQISSAIAPHPLGSVFSSQIFDVTTGSQNLVVELGAEDVRQMVAFEGVDHREYLLLAANTSGQILRLDTTDGSLVPIATELPGPNALTLDPINGDLFVAAGTQVLSIDRAGLNTGLTSTALEYPAPRLSPPHGIAFLDDDTAGIAVNPCTGNVVISTFGGQTGRLIEIDRLTGARTVLEELISGHLLFLLRIGIGCPQGAQLLGVQADQQRIFLRSFDGDVIDWALLPNPSSLTELPAGSPFDNEDGIVISQRAPQSDLFIVETPRIYRPGTPAINPPFIPPLEAGRVTFAFSGEISGTSPDLGLTVGDPVTGFFFYDLEKAEFLFSGLDSAFYQSPPGSSGIELTAGQQTFRAVIEAPRTMASIAVVNDAGEFEPLTDQFFLTYGNGFVDLVDRTGIGLIDSLALPEEFNFIPEEMEGTVTFDFFNPDFTTFNANLTSLRRIN